MDPDNSEYADEPGSCASDSPLHLAIRETRKTAASPRFWMGLAAVILILAIAAPFDTAAHFSFSTLMVYWGAIAVCTFFLALPISVAVSTWSNRRGLLLSMSWLMGGVAAGAPVAGFVFIFNQVFFDIDPISDHGAVRFIVECMLIAIAVMLIFRLTQSRTTNDERATASARHVATSTPSGQSIPASETHPVVMQPPVAERTPFHQRLDPKLGDDIVTLQAQDHYVDVTTTVGHEMILMRLVDAERELDTLPGMQVHRSWWVAARHMSSIVRQDGRTFVALDTGTLVPVSRSRIGELRKILVRRS